MYLTRVGFQPLAHESDATTRPLFSKSGPVYLSSSMLFFILGECGRVHISRVKGPWFDIRAVPGKFT